MPKDTLEDRRTAVFRTAVWVGYSGPTLIVAAALLTWIGSMYPEWKTLLDLTAVVLGSLGGALLSVLIGEIWWGRITRDETQRSLANAVSGVFAQDPEFVAEYFKDDVILGFISKNIEAQTADKELAHAIASDLISPFVRGADSATRIRRSQRYAVNLQYCTGPSEKDGFMRQGSFWRVVENLCFEERLPVAIHGEAVVAVFVFCESALGPWFEKTDCMYRTVVDLPPEVSQASAAEREKWIADNLDCCISIGGVDLDLDQEAAMNGDSEEDWVVKYSLRSADADIIDGLQAAARDMADTPDGLATLDVSIQAKTTFSTHHHSYTAYLVYPTKGPVIEFQIDGPIRRLECAAFYSRAMPAPGSLSAGDVKVNALDGLPRNQSRHLQVKLAHSRWVFPTSGASFSWTMCDPPDTRDSGPAVVESQQADHRTLGANGLEHDEDRADVISDEGGQS